MVERQRARADRASAVMAETGGDPSFPRIYDANSLLWEEYHTHTDVLIGDVDAASTPTTTDQSSAPAPAPASNASVFSSEPVSNQNVLNDPQKDALAGESSDTSVLT